jgi:hypothetical protein
MQQFTSSWRRDLVDVQHDRSIVIAIEELELHVVEEADQGA